MQNQQVDVVRHLDTLQPHEIYKMYIKCGKKPALFAKQNGISLVVFNKSYLPIILEIQRKIDDKFFAELDVTETDAKAFFKLQLKMQTKVANTANEILDKIHKKIEATPADLFGEESFDFKTMTDLLKVLQKFNNPYSKKDDDDDEPNDQENPAKGFFAIEHSDSEQNSRVQSALQETREL